MVEKALATAKSIPETYDARSVILRPNLQGVRHSFTDEFHACSSPKKQTVRLRYLSLRLPNKMVPNITPRKKMVAVALFFPLWSHTRSHFHIKKEETR